MVGCFQTQSVSQFYSRVHNFRLCFLLEKKERRKLSDYNICGNGLQSISWLDNTMVYSIILHTDNQEDILLS